MTEAEWLACEEPESMLEFVRTKASDRKLRLFAVGCCRSISHLFPDEPHFARLAFAELLAERKDTRADRRRNSKLRCRGEPTSVWSALASACEPSPYWAAINTSQSAAVALSGIRSDRGWWRKQDRVAQASLVRDILGNPCRPVSVDPSWLTSTVLALVRRMYESCDFSAMPILADALQDAGCDSAGVLDHCRGAERHVRGCWVVDLVLGKE